jgi:hypothetical protein
MGGKGRCAHAGEEARRKYVLAYPPGAGGLATTRLEVVLEGPLLTGGTAIAYRDTNYADRLGWKEIVVGAKTPSISDSLRAYPKELLKKPLSQTSTRTTLTPARGVAVAPKLDTGAALQAPGRVADTGSRRSSPRNTCRRWSFWLRSRPRCSGAWRTCCRRVTARRSSPRTLWGSAGRRGMRRCSV